MAGGQAAPLGGSPGRFAAVCGSRGPAIPRTTWKWRRERYNTGMTIDERLDRLTERHEALTQSVELLFAGQRATELLQQKNETLMAQVIESINRLANIAHLHEQRIEGLENS